MKKPLQSLPALRIILLVSLLALPILTGCGRIRRWFTPANLHSVTIGWTAGNSSIAGYNVYRISQFSGPIRLTTRIVTSTQYIDKDVEAGRTYSYYVTSVDFKGLESLPSQKISVTVPTTVTVPAKQ
jgi:fibronectin type 3 domain-containing protein